jgi:acyl dehydratase
VSLFVRDGEGFVGTECTGSAWDPSTQSGGAVLALLGHVLEDVPTLVPMSLTRLTVDIVRPVPVGQRLDIGAEIVREGKKIQLVDLVVTAGDVVTTRARALRVRDRDVAGLPGMATSTTDVNPTVSIPPPEAVPAVEPPPGMCDFLRLGAEVRRTDEAVGGVHVAWCRFRVPVIDGEPIRATSRAALPLDVVNMLGVRDLDPRVASSINPDVSGHLSRAPVDEWVALTGNTHYDHGVGHGVSMAVLSDSAGAFGVTSTSQLLDPR